MSGCKFCARLRRWLGMDPAIDCAAIWRSHWDEANSWDTANSNHDELYWEDSERNRELIQEGFERMQAEPEAAFRIFQEAAEAGSPYALEVVGWHYDTGTAVEADFEQAANHYHRAICAGSWMATILYARLLAEHDHFDDAEAVLQDGIELGFIPATYWLAQLRYARASTRATCREIRSLLAEAVKQGNPAAQQMLGRLMIKGKYGILAIPRGLGLLRESRPPILKQLDTAPADRPKGRPLTAATQA